MVNDCWSYIAKTVENCCSTRWKRQTFNPQIAKCHRSNCPSILQDIIFEILIRLPAKSLLRFKLVCKSWKLLLSDPVFVDSHVYQQRKKDPSLLILILGQKGNNKPVTFYTIQNHAEEGYCSIRSFWTKFLPYNERVLWFPHHYDGLLLFSTPKLVCVCNPATREFVLLPPNYDLSTERYCAAESARLGFNRSTKKYEVVRLFYRDKAVRSYHMVMEVFTLGTGSKSWRQIEEVPQYSFPDLRDTPASVGGGVYWKLDDKSLQDSSHKAILRFDMSSEKFSSVNPPPSPLDLYRFEITEFQGSLCCMHSRQDGLYSVFQMWMTKDFDKDHAWTLSIKIVTDTYLHYKIPLSLHQGGSWIVQSVGGRVGGWSYYTPHTGFKELKVFTDPSDPWSVFPLNGNYSTFYPMTQYVENIVSICASK